MPDTPPEPGRDRVRSILRQAWPTVVFDVAGPLVLYLVLTGAGVGTVPALLWSAVPPLAGVAVAALRERRVDAVGVIVLVSIATGFVLPLFGGDDRAVVARDAYPNSLLALVLGGSLLVGRRPLLYHLVRAPAAEFVPGARESFEHQWRTNPRFRRFLRLATAVTALALLAESVARLAAAGSWPVPVTLTVFNVEGVVLWAALAVLFVRGLMRAYAHGTGR